MNDKPNWKVARIEDIERRGRDIPVREHLGIQSFGMNAYKPGDDGTLIGEHDEAGSGQEELYIVLDGHATFEVDGETVDAPTGTFVFVPPEARRKATGDGTVLALGGTPGEAYEAIDWGDAWRFHSDSMTAYSEQRYADALEAVRNGLEHVPDSAGLNYNYACFATLAGETGDETFDHLRRSIELRPQFREQARRDDDFAAVRDDPRFEEALRLRRPGYPSVQPGDRGRRRAGPGQADAVQIVLVGSTHSWRPRRADRPSERGALERVRNVQAQSARATRSRIPPRCALSVATTPSTRTRPRRSQGDASRFHSDPVNAARPGAAAFVTAELRPGREGGGTWGTRGSPTEASGAEGPATRDRGAQI